MFTNCSVGAFRRSWREMIEFSLRVEPRLIQAVLPELGKVFASSQRKSTFTFVCPNPLDEDLVEAWEEGLAEEARSDRSALARLLRDSKFAHGRVEVEEDEAEDLLRGLTELRLAIRSLSLSEVPDEELESGELALEGRDSSLRIGYFAYLILAEVQENLIEGLG
jgi:hypothetical protein